MYFRDSQTAQLVLKLSGPAPQSQVLIQSLYCQIPDSWGCATLCVGLTLDLQLEQPKASPARLVPRSTDKPGQDLRLIQDRRETMNSYHLLSSCGPVIIFSMVIHQTWAWHSLPIPKQHRIQRRNECCKFNKKDKKKGILMTFKTKETREIWADWICPCANCNVHTLIGGMQSDTATLENSSAHSYKVKYYHMAQQYHS